MIARRHTIIYQMVGEFIKMKNNLQEKFKFNNFINKIKNSAQTIDLNCDICEQKNAVYFLFEAIEANYFASFCKNDFFRYYKKIDDFYLVGIKGISENDKCDFFIEWKNGYFVL